MQVKDLTGIDVIWHTPWHGDAKLSKTEKNIYSWFNSTFYLDIGHICNQNCLYCWQKQEAGSFVDLAELSKKIAIAKKLSIRQVILIGGEPLIHPNFDKTIELLKNAGFTKFGLMSNGLLLSNEHTLKKLVRQGLSYCQLSFDSHDKAIQNKLAGNNKLYDKLFQAIKNLSKYPEVAVDLNCVVNKLNVGDLDKLVLHVDSLKQTYKINPLLVLVFMKPDRTIDNELFISAYEAAKHISKAVNLGEKLKLSVHYRNLPFCVFENIKHKSADYLCQPFRYEDFGLPFDHPNNGAVKIAVCKKCVERETCPGINENYINLMGSTEFEAIGQQETDSNIYTKKQWWNTLTKQTMSEQPMSVNAANSTYLDIGKLTSNGSPEYFEYEKIFADLAKSEKNLNVKVILTGAEVSLHPNLPEIIKRLSQKNHLVYLETTAIIFGKSDRIKKLADCGLCGILWLRLFNDNPFYKNYFKNGLSHKIEQKISQNLIQSGIEIEHIFILTPLGQKKIIKKLAKFDTSDKITITNRHYNTKLASWFHIDAPLKDDLENQVKEIKKMYPLGINFELE